MELIQCLACERTFLPHTFPIVRIDGCTNLLLYVMCRWPRDSCSWFSARGCWCTVGAIRVCSIIGVHVNRVITVTSSSITISKSEWTKFDHLFCWSCDLDGCLWAIASDAAGELNVLGHDGHTLCVDGGKISVLEETDEVCFDGFLEGKDCGSLETEYSLVILRTRFTKEFSSASDVKFR